MFAKTLSLKETGRVCNCSEPCSFLTFNPNNLLLSVGGNLLEKAKNEFEIRRKNREERRRKEKEIKQTQAVDWKRVAFF